jgi:hypothetical protein
MSAQRFQVMVASPAQGCRDSWRARCRIAVYWLQSRAARAAQREAVSADRPRISARIVWGLAGELEHGGLAGGVGLDAAGDELAADVLGGQVFAGQEMQDVERAAWGPA